MGKTRKPIDMQKAHLTLVEKQNRKMEEESVTTGNNQLKTPPKWLINDTAKKEWRRIVKELNKISIVGNLDYANLGGYCNAYANYIKATDILKEQGCKDLKQVLVMTVDGNGKSYLQKKGEKYKVFDLNWEEKLW